MNNEQHNRPAAQVRHNDTDSVRTFSVQDIIDMMLDRWYWFVVSVVVCVGLGVYYLASTPKVYKRQATILVKDSRKGGGTDISAFSDILGMTQRRNVDNELYVLQSRRLMTDVVRRLGLCTGYVTREGLRPADLYGRSPIEAVWIDRSELFGCSFDVAVGSGGRMTISNFRGNELKRADRRFSVEAAAGDTVVTPVGKITVTPTLYMSPEYEGRTITVRNNPEAVVAGALREQVQSSVANKMSSIIELSLSDIVPARAEDILNGLIQAYNDDAVDDKQRIAEVTAEFIDERLEVIGSELGAVDETIEAFKRRNNIFDLKTEATKISTESTKYKADGLSIENQVRVARFVRDYLSDEKNKTSLIPVTSTFAGNAGSAINKQIDEYNMMVLRRERYVAGNSDNNPVVRDLEMNMTAMRNSIMASLASHVSSLEIQLDGIRREERLTDSRISSAPSQEKEYLSIARQQRIKEELYLYLLNKREENAMSIAITENNARVVDAAFGQPLPVYPISAIVLLLSLVAGVAIPFLVIYVGASLDTSLRGRKDIERHLSIPYLGDIPVHDGAVPENGVAVRENGRDATSEAFRILRTNMSFMNLGSRSSQVIQVVSSTPHAGKTFVSMNLGVTLAMSGRKVVIVDLDLRRRMLTKQAGHRHDPEGVSSYLSGSTPSVEGIIVRSEVHDNLDMVFAGLQPPNPSELLMSDKLERLFAELRERYDCVLVDSVPAMAVADAVITNRLCDICIYVIREGYLDRRQLPDIEELHRSGRLSNMCVVLNGATSTRKGYGYGYGYDCEDDDAYMYRGVVGKIKRFFAHRKRHNRRKSQRKNQRNNR